MLELMQRRPYVPRQTAHEVRQMIIDEVVPDGGFATIVIDKKE